MLAEKLAGIYTDVSSPQAIAELASISLESRNLPDCYHFYFADGKLVSPLIGKSVEDCISHTSPVDEAECEAFLNIQHWVGQNDKGLVFWLSPPHLERSKQAKIIVSELDSLNGNKILINRSILFDASADVSITIANKIQEFFSNPKGGYVSEDQLRRQPIFIDKNYTIQEWVPIVERIIEAQNQWEMISTGEDFKEVERTIEWARGGCEANNFLGLNNLSCPLVQLQSAFDLFGTHSVEGKFVNRCGKCGIEIKKVISKGYTCVCGGTYQGC